MVTEKTREVHERGGVYLQTASSRVEPRGFEPLTSAVQRRQVTLPEVSGACKIAANCRICPSARFSRFQEIYSGCCTVAAQTLPLLPPHKVREDRYPTSRLEPPYASFVLGTFPAAKQSMSPAEGEASADEDCILDCKECSSNAEDVPSVICTLN